MPVTERTTVLAPVPADRPGWDNHAGSRSGSGSRAGSGSRSGPRAGSGFASASVPRHLARGAVGFGSLIAAFALLPVLGPAALLLAPVGVVALRGCPMCWAIGLAETVSRGRLRRECTDGVCELKPASR
ncbi:hypothetical protein ACFYUL_23175 [Streptomyces sp. NPDC004311]|uniref:hypothetical protein n=1 Tax=Streptomyces sp. NPDC004311 TaxID=3364698 RepID=UPI0036B40B5E